MSRGGARPGAGRKAGVPNKASIERQAAIAASGLAPLEYMLSVMRDPSAPEARRDEMAKSAAPYVHPKLAAIEHTGKGGGPIEVANLSDDQLAAIAAGRGAGTPAQTQRPEKLN